MHIKVHKTSMVNYLVSQKKVTGIYSKTCLKRSLKNRPNQGLKTIGSLMNVESIAECSLGAFCNTFDLH